MNKQGKYCILSQQTVKQCREMLHNRPARIDVGCILWMLAAECCYSMSGFLELSPSILPKLESDPHRSRVKNCFTELLIIPLSAAGL